MDWVDPIPSTGETKGVRPILQIAGEPVEGRGDDMSNLAVGFSMWMCKRAANT